MVGCTVPVDTGRAVPFGKGTACLCHQVLRVPRELVSRHISGALQPLCGCSCSSVACFGTQPSTVSLVPRSVTCYGNKSMEPSGRYFLPHHLPPAFGCASPRNRQHSYALFGCAAPFRCFVLLSRLCGRCRCIFRMR